MSLPIRGTRPNSEQNPDPPIRKPAKELLDSLFHQREDKEERTTALNPEEETVITER